MGLSKLGSETVGQIPPPGLRERELRRRVWWNIIFMDWYLSPMVGHSYLIHPAQFNTAFPANLNWEEMADGRRFEPRDRNQWSEAAFLISKAEVAESVRELVSFSRFGNRAPITICVVGPHQCGTSVDVRLHVGL